MILPANWAMPFWIALVYQGARVGCLEEFANVSYEASMLHFPGDFIDTAVGKTVNDDKAQELQDHYNRQEQYILNISSITLFFRPSCEWSAIARTW